MRLKAAVRERGKEETGASSRAEFRLRTQFLVGEYR